MTAEHPRPEDGDGTLVPAREKEMLERSVPRSLLTVATPQCSTRRGDQDDDLPPLDYDGEDADADPIFAELNRAMWAPVPTHGTSRESVGAVGAQNRAAPSPAPSDTRSAAYAFPGDRQEALAVFFGGGRPAHRALPVRTGDAGTAKVPVPGPFLRPRRGPVRLPAVGTPRYMRRASPERLPFEAVMAVAIGCLYISGKIAGYVAPALVGVLLHICLWMGCWWRSRRSPRQRRDRV